MREAYDRLFLAFYGWSLKVDGPKGIYNVYFAGLALSLALLLNVFSVGMLIELLVSRPVLSGVIGMPTPLWILIFTGFCMAHCTYFRYRDRYRVLIESRGTNEERLARGPHRKLVGYMLGSLAALVLLLVITFGMAD